jgi:signal transduction histidine kinase
VFFGVSVATGSGRLSVTAVLTHLVGLAAIAGIAAFVRIRAEHFAEVRERVAESKRRQASEERLLLARELHDALAHNVSLISVQASTALHLFDEDPERARSALAAIKTASHETLQELRATVGALRADGEQVPTSPTAGLERLGELVAQSRGVGVEVRLQRLGDVRVLPTQVELAAYRIVQEALTNVRRHSGAAAADVVVDYHPDALEIRVTDSGRGPVPAKPGSAVEHQPGHGLRGMRERAHALGGTLRVGPGAAGGFVVAARLPLEVAQPSAPTAGRAP